jgi:hypothetical protein
MGAACSFEREPGRGLAIALAALVAPLVVGDGANDGREGARGRRTDGRRTFKRDDARIVTAQRMLGHDCRYGDYIEQSPAWAPRYAACKAFAAAVNRAGGHVDVAATPQLGMHGNSHMLMQDRNNLQIADAVVDWISHNAR